MNTGTLYDGEGVRLQGDGPAMSPDWVDALPFKLLLQHSDEKNPEMRKEDRYWFIAKKNDRSVSVSPEYAEMLAGLLIAGKKLAVMSDDPHSAAGICNMLLLICRSASGSA